MSDTIVWISGATGGIGGALARHVPYANARIINLDIQDAPGLETVRFDLRKPETCEAVADHFAAELGRFRGRRAVFLQNAFVQASMGLIGRVDRAGYRTSLTSNFTSPLLLGEAFLRAAKPGYELGLMMMSSGSAQGRIGQSAYGAAKAGIEKWVEVARQEFHDRPDTWIVAVRPGLVRTATALKGADLPADVYPRTGVLKELFNTVGVDPDLGGRRIWQALPPRPGRALISFDGSTTEQATI